MKINRYWKAVVAAVVAGAGSLGTALNDGTLTTGEGLTAAAALLGALGLTWLAPNKAPNSQTPN